MKFDILNRFTGAVQFTAEIEDSGIRSVNMGLAVKWGVDNDTDLSFADLRFADLRSADLSSANLRFADLRFADLSFADLIVIMLPIWTVYITKEHVRIGCKHYTHNEWANFADDEISEMDSEALEWWKTHKNIVMAGIEAVKAQNNGQT